MPPPDEPLLDDLVAVSSETVSNAIEHTASGWEGGRVTVALLAGPGGYLLEVADDGADGARPYVKDEDGGESGRGMRVVEALARSWGCRADADRTIVWAELARPDHWPN